MKGAYSCDWPFLPNTTQIRQELSARPYIRQTHMTYWTDERITAYRIVRAWECGSRTLTRIWNTFKHYPDFFQHPDWLRKLRLTDTQVRSLNSSMRLPVDTDINTMEREQIRFLLPWDETFPAALKHIPNPPAALFVRGDERPDELRVSMVGTRTMTAYGQRCAVFLARELALHGVTVVSGLAIGIDAESHKGCLGAEGRTIAVLPSGINDRSIVPQTNQPLAAHILKTDGMLISENAPGTPTLPYQFLHRNRLIAGLSDATIIIEADRDSGAITTAKLALEQGRDVLAVPGSIWSSASRGTNELIRNGARPCTSLDDVWWAIGLHSGREARSVNETRTRLPESSQERSVLACLETPMSVDDVTRMSGLRSADVGAIMSMLEMKGRIIAVGPKVYAKV